MMEHKKKILLLCGGAFAFNTLQILANEKYLFAVGLGKAKLEIQYALEDACEKSSIHFKKFNNKQDVTHLQSWILELNPDLVFCVSFPFKIPEALLVAFGENKCVNFHPGPLPQYRGVMPIFEVIKNQEKQTAICAHFMNDKWDEGNIIFNDPIAISTNETYGSLTTKMSIRLAQVVLNAAEMFQFAKTIPSQKQNENEANYYGKPEYADTKIDWENMEADEIIALINACNPWNEGADTTLDGKPFKIIEAKMCSKKHENIMPGTIIKSDNPNEMIVTCLNRSQISVSIIKNENGFLSIENANERNSFTNKRFF